MKVLVPVYGPLFLADLFHRCISRFGLRPVYVYNGPDRDAFADLVGDRTTVYLDHNPDWVQEWERVARLLNRCDDILMMDSDLFLRSQGPLEFIKRDHRLSLVGAFRRQRGYSPQFLWIKRNLLDAYPHISFLRVYLDGVFYDVLGYLTSVMADSGEPHSRLPQSDMIHIGGISMAMREIVEADRTLANVAGVYDLNTLDYIAQSMTSYKHLYRKLSLPGESFPELNYQRMATAITARGVSFPERPSPSVAALENHLAHLATLGTV